MGHRSVLLVIGKYLYCKKVIPTRKSLTDLMLTEKNYHLQGTNITIDRLNKFALITRREGAFIILVLSVRTIRLFFPQSKVYF